MNRQRQDYRDALENAIDQDDNHYLKDYLVTITSQKTDYPIDLFKKDVRIINAMINKKFFKRRYKRSPNRIAFYCFFEKSANKLLTHCHLIMRIPNYLKEKIEILMCIAEKCVLKFRYFIHFKKVPYSVSYMTKHYSNHNDNFEVF